jgi:hypothetical protein
MGLMDYRDPALDERQFGVTRAIIELHKAGWPSVADDLEDGVPPETVLRRLREIGEGDSDASYIVGYWGLS